MQKMDLLTAIRGVVKLYDGMLKEVCAEFGLTAMEAKIIGFLHHHPERNTIAEITEYRMLSKGNVSQSAEQLIRRNLLERSPDPEDRRRAHLSLRPASRAVTVRIEAIAEAFRERIFAGFTGREQEQFGIYLERMLQNTGMCGQE